MLDCRVMSVWIGSVLCPLMLWQRISGLPCWLLLMIELNALYSKPLAKAPYDVRQVNLDMGA